MNFCSRASQAGGAIAGTGVHGHAYVFLPVAKQTWGRSEMNAAWASPEELQAIKLGRRHGLVTRLYHPRRPDDAVLVYRGGSGGEAEALAHLLAAFGARWPVDDGEAPRFAVCTQGTRDRCCAKWGFAVYRQAQALHAAGRFPFEPLECSHLGGDRFAATGVVFPSGSMYAHLDQADLEALAAAEAADAIAAGDHYRGRVFDDELIQIVRAGLARDGFARHATAPIAVVDPDHPEAGHVRVTLNGGRDAYEVRLGAAETRFYASCSAMDAGKLSRGRRVVYAGAEAVDL